MHGAAVAAGAGVRRAFTGAKTANTALGTVVGNVQVGQDRGLRAGGRQGNASSVGIPTAAAGAVGAAEGDVVQGSQIDGRKRAALTALAAVARDKVVVVEVAVVDEDGSQGRHVGCDREIGNGRSPVGAELILGVGVFVGRPEAAVEGIDADAAHVALAEALVIGQARTGRDEDRWLHGAHRIGGSTAGDVHRHEFARREARGEEAHADVALGVDGDAGVGVEGIGAAADIALLPQGRTTTARGVDFVPLNLIECVGRGVPVGHLVGGDNLAIGHRRIQDARIGLDGNRLKVRLKGRLGLEIRSDGQVGRGEGGAAERMLRRPSS